MISIILNIDLNGERFDQYSFFKTRMFGVLWCTFHENNSFYKSFLNGELKTHREKGGGKI